MTTKAQKFIDRNRLHPITAGAWLTSDKRQIYTQADHDDATFLRYSFSGGGVMTLHKDDVAAVQAAGHTPIWADRSAAATA